MAWFDRSLRQGFNRLGPVLCAFVAAVRKDADARALTLFLPIARWSSQLAKATSVIRKRLASKAATITGLALVLLLLVLVVFLSTLVQQPLGEFWLLVLSGNWSPAALPERQTAWFQRGLAPAVAMLLSLGMITVVAALWFRMAREWRRSKMLISDALLAKDVLVQQALYNELPFSDLKTREAVDNAFKIANEQWRKHLIAIFSEREVDEFFSALEAESETEQRGIR